MCLTTDPNTIVFIAPELGRAVLTILTQHSVPSIQLRSRNASSTRKNRARATRVRHQKLDAFLGNTSLGGSRCGDARCRGSSAFACGCDARLGNAHAIVLVAPELRSAILAVVT
jgi:hypothetical protein